MAKEPRSDFARYAFGYSDKKPGWAFWLVQAIVVAGALWACVDLGLIDISFAGDAQ